MARNSLSESTPYPRLKIADRCTLSERFLIIHGALRTYKIHLGSGNILMSPNDQYLCIVPKQAVAGHERVFLPFEGDNTLSVILSKALLLADDTKITDPTITSQLKKGREFPRLPGSRAPELGSSFVSRG